MWKDREIENVGEVLVRKRQGYGVLLALLCVYAMVVPIHSVGKSEYYMDDHNDCRFIGLIDVGRDQRIVINGRRTDVASTQGACTLNFKALDSDANLELEFLSFAVKSCDIKLYLHGDASGNPQTYSCGDPDPRTYFTVGRTITITLHKIQFDNQDYQFMLALTAKRDSKYIPNSDSNPVAVGMVIGIVGAVFGVIFIGICMGICCFRKYRGRNRTPSPYMYEPDGKVKLDDCEEARVGYTNDSMRHGSPMSKKKLLAQSDSSDDKSDFNNPGRPKTLNLRGNNRPNNAPQRSNNVPAPPPMPEKKNDFNEKGVDVGSKRKETVLGALHSNPKFRNSFHANERDAEKRAQRISSSSSFDKFGDAPSPPSSNENVSRPSLPPVPKSPKGKKASHATINRIPRPASMSSEELGNIERGVHVNSNNRHRDSRDESHTSSSSTDNLPSRQSEPNKKKGNTTHSLKPDRKGKKKNTKSVSSTVDQKQNTRDERNDDRSRDRRDRVGDASLPPLGHSRDPRDRVASTGRDLDDSFMSQGSGRYNKKARKSPKSSGRGFNRRGRSMDHLDSRPTTPTSQFGSMEDLESLPPMQRSSSKNSLYASRSSLYDRRGRRRKGSDAGSVKSYGTARSCHYDSYSDDDDDFDGYEKPISRRERQRMYRSENDLGRDRRGKEIATQTLRETATQTGADQSVTHEQKFLSKKKRRSKSTSSSGTQTGVKKNKNRMDEEKQTSATETSDKKTKSKTKRAKSLNALDATDASISTDKENVQKPAIKPKPKPRPRKSTSALDDNDKAKSVSAENLADDNKTPYYPQSEGFVPQGYYPPQPGYPMGPYPGQPGGQYPPPPQGVPYGVQGYPPNMYPPPQPPQQQQPHMVANGNLPNLPTNKPIPRKQKQSNWELLCELTEGERPRDDVTETGSIASSVFTNNPATAGVPVYNGENGNQGYYNQPGYGYQPQPQHYPAYIQQPAAVSFAPPQTQRVPNGVDQPMGKQKSWEALQELTGSKGQPEKKQEKIRTESIV